MNVWVLVGLDEALFSCRGTTLRRPLIPRWQVKYIAFTEVLSGPAASRDSSAVLKKMVKR